MPPRKCYNPWHLPWPTRTRQARAAPTAHPEPADDARIEHLLVTGLDHYFAGEFEQAINLWTRVLFLDRNHDRARAYIDRARSAQAERQRMSEALVHQGLDAFDKGEVVRARELLSDALDQGASHDVALGVLGRIDRLDVGPDGRARCFRRFARRPFSTAGGRRARATASRHAGACGGRPRRRSCSWRRFRSCSSRRTVWPTGSRRRPRPARPRSCSPTPAPLPIPAPAEAYLAQARAMFASGKLRDALRALDRVPVGDALRADAERLRADIQRELLAVASAEASRPRRRPPRRSRHHQNEVPEVRLSRV